MHRLSPMTLIASAASEAIFEKKDPLYRLGADALIPLQAPPSAAVDCFDGSDNPKRREKLGGRCAGRSKPPRAPKRRKGAPGRPQTVKTRQILNSAAPKPEEMV
jgi:hypothetical protein